MFSLPYSFIATSNIGNENPRSDLIKNEISLYIRKRIEKAYENNELADWEKYSASVGIAEYASDDDSYELVFKRADKHMYEEKKAFKEKCGSYR